MTSVNSSRVLLKLLEETKPRKLFKFLYQLPKFGVGRRFTRVIWKDESVPEGEPRFGDPSSYWTITKVKPDRMLKSGEVWGVRTWRGFNPSARTFKKIQELINQGDVSAIQKCEELDGVKLMNTIPAALIAEQRDKLVIRPDDVFVATYPKCGTTWTQQIVKLIVNNGVDNGVLLDEFFAWHEHMTLEEIESMASPRFLKSHLPYHLMPGGGDPENTKAKYINVLRNPKDVYVSYYNHNRKAIPSQFVPPHKAFFEGFLGNFKMSYGPFYDHFLGWWAHKDAPNILILTYEQMKRDPRTAVTTIATFLGYNLTNEVIDKIVIDTSFDKMKDNKAANKETGDNGWLGDQNVKFMRKGIIGDWRNTLTAEESARIDAVVADKMRDSGIVFDYGDD